MVAMATFKAFNSFCVSPVGVFLYFWQHFPDNHKFITSHSTAVIFSFPSINDEIKYFLPPPIFPLPQQPLRLQYRQRPDGA